jgi:hypothetical protein
VRVLPADRRLDDRLLRDRALRNGEIGLEDLAGGEERRQLRGRDLRLRKHDHAAGLRIDAMHDEDRAVTEAEELLQGAFFPLARRRGSHAGRLVDGDPVAGLADHRQVRQLLGERDAVTLADFA